MTLDQAACQRGQYQWSLSNTKSGDLSDADSLCGRTIVAELMFFSFDRVLHRPLAFGIAAGAVGLDVEAVLNTNRAKLLQQDVCHSQNLDVRSSHLDRRINTSRDCRVFQLSVNCPLRQYHSRRRQSKNSSFVSFHLFKILLVFITLELKSGGGKKGNRIFRSL